MELKFTKLGKDYLVVDHAALPQVSQDYLTNYGYQQSMQDTIAGVSKAVSVEYAEEVAKMTDRPAAEAQAQELSRRTAAAIEGQLGKRYDAILAGEVGIRVSQERDPLASIAREEIWTALRKPENAEKKKAINAMEKDARTAKLAELVKAHVEKHKARLETEAQRRAAAVAGVEVTVDL